MSRVEPHDVRGLARLLGDVQRRLEAAEREALVPLGLTPSTFRLLDHLAASGGDSPTGAARALGVQGPTVSGWVAALTGAGLVERARSGDDGRRADLRLTAAGVRAHVRGADLVRRRQLRLLARVDPSAQADLLDALRTIAAPGAEGIGPAPPGS